MHQDFIIIFTITLAAHVFSSDVCFKEEPCIKETKFRYLFYDTNPPEGFNLRRDVYLRFAMLSHNFKVSGLGEFKLVLPPWSHLVHWQYSDHPEHIPWGLYFDLDSLRMFAPVIEMHEFFSDYPRKYSKVEVDEVYTLQHFKGMFETGKFEDDMKIDECVRRYEHDFLHYRNITAKKFYCLSYHGPATKLADLLSNTTARTVFIEHAEVALHDYFGGQLYWQARRSMRFSKELRQIAREFRKVRLDSSDEKDNTALPDSWKHERSKRSAIGGPYVGIHVRRRDFVRSRTKDAPALKTIATQVVEVLERLRLKTVFVATDGSLEEFAELSKLLSKYKIVKYDPPFEVKQKYRDGGAAIIDQIVCSHARHFIGTHESTFSFRIQEEREILGFPTNATFNVFCKDKTECAKPSVWKIVY